MQLGSTDHIWTIAELMDAALHGVVSPPQGRKVGLFRTIEGGPPMPYRLIVTDLMNRTSRPTEAYYGPTPKVDDIVDSVLGRARVTKVDARDPADDVHAQVQ